jgi:glycerol-3-phosphate dehydrogenase
MLSMRAPRRDDLLQLLDRVEIEPDRDAETVAQRIGEQAEPRRRADQRELRQLDLHRARRRDLADDQVELEILHRRIEHLLHGRAEAVDLVDEQHVALFQIGEQRREVAGLGDHRAGGRSGS